ncbi:MAG: endo-1,4-beta-xylanase [bacterium]
MRVFSRLVPVFLFAAAVTRAFAASDSVTVPAANFSHLSVGGPVEDGWNLWSDGFGVCGFDFIEGGACTVVVGARGQPLAGQWPEMEVRLDEEKMFSVTVDQPYWTPYSMTVEIPSGHHEVAVLFTNDGVSSNEDRNLHLKYLTVISLDGHLISGPTPPDEYRQRHATLADQLLGEARKRIEEIRMGQVYVSVVDAAGNPVKGATVSVRQVRHEFQFGAALASRMFSADASEGETQRYLAEVKRLFNCAVPENAMKWPDMQPAEKELRYDVIDRMAHWCAVNGIPLRGHNLVWECERFLPSWAKALPDEALRAALKERVRSVVVRYKGRIDEFDVDNEMLHCDYLSRRLGPSVRQELFFDAREANPRAVLYVNDYGIVEGGKLDAYVDQIRELLSRGVPLGGIGVQVHVSGDVDVVELDRTLTVLGKFHLPVKITEFSCDAEDERVQAETLEHVYRTAFAHPAVSGILMWGFWEKAHGRPRAAMLRADFEQKPSATVYEDLVHHEWSTQALGFTGADGRFSCRAFHGELEVTVRRGEDTQTAAVSLSSSDPETAVELTLP